MSRSRADVALAIVAAGTMRTTGPRAARSSRSAAAGSGGPEGQTTGDLAPPETGTRETDFMPVCPRWAAHGRCRTSVPPRDTEPEVRIRLGPDRGMVHAVDVGGHDHQPQHPIDGPREGQVGVMEQGRRVQQHLERHDGCRRHAQQCDRGELDQHRQHDFAGVKPDPGAHVHLEIRMVDPVEAPQERDVMESCVLGVDHEVEQHDSEQARSPVGNAEGRYEADAVGGCQGGPLDREQGEEQPERDGVDGGQCQIHPPPPDGVGARRRAGREHVSRTAMTASTPTNEKRRT